ncbi:MAG: hypothetical protein Q4B70_00735, partial [Lachnospiraceae bacterium]|nr:hypothetical protein [Lachnospiraceae bacterium]
LRTMQKIKENLFMVELIIDGILAVSALAGAGYVLKNNATKARKIFSTTFVLTTAVYIAFSIAQICSMVGILTFTLSYSPITILGLSAVIFWISFVTANGKMFDKLVGE